MSVDSIAPSGARSVERNGLVSGLEQVPSTVLAVAGARVYHTKLNAKDTQWNYSQWKGTLSFGKDIDAARFRAHGTSETEKYWFRLADDETGRTVWMFKFPEQFEYLVDRPFFHVFQGRTRRYGFLFNDDDEASIFGNEVISRIYNGKLPKKMKAFKTSSSRNTATPRSKSLSSGPISRAMISSPAPNSFKHVAHVGVNQDGVLEASNDLDNSWKSILANLQGYGVSDDIVLRQSNFGDGFWKAIQTVG